MGAASLGWKVRDRILVTEWLELFILTQRVIVYSCEGSARRWRKNKHWEGQEDADMCPGEFFEMNDKAFHAITTPGT